MAGLPADLAATVLVGLHVPSTARRYLADILQRRCSGEVVAAEDGRLVKPGPGRAWSAAC